MKRSRKSSAAKARQPAAQAYDGDKFKPRLLKEFVLPLGDFADVDLEILKADLETGNRRLSRIARRFRMRGGKPRVCLTDFEGGEIVFEADTLNKIIARVTAHFSNPANRWRTGYLQRGSGRQELSNPNYETVQIFTDGQRQWMNRRFKRGGGMSNCPAALAAMNGMFKNFKKPSPRDRLEWAKQAFDSLPKVKDLEINTMDGTERWIAFEEFEDGTRIETEGTTHDEAVQRLLAQSKNIKARMVRGEIHPIPREYRVERHPLNEAKEPIAIALARGIEVFELRGDDSEAARAWQAGLDLGMAFRSYDRVAATPESLRSAAMNPFAAGSRQKNTRIYLKEALLGWLRSQGPNGLTAKLALAGFWEFAESRKPEFVIRGSLDKNASIRHRKDRVGYKVNHLERNVLPTLLKAFSESRSAERPH